MLIQNSTYLSLFVLAKNNHFHCFSKFSANIQNPGHGTIAITIPLVRRTSHYKNRIPVKHQLSFLSLPVMLYLSVIFVFIFVCYIYLFLYEKNASQEKTPTYTKGGRWSHTCQEACTQTKESNRRNAGIFNNILQRFIYISILFIYFSPMVYF